MSYSLAGLRNTIVALDIERWRIKFLKELSSGNVMVVQGDACYLPFRAKAFDLCIASQVIEHILDDKKMIGEIERVLKLRGAIYVSTVYPKRNGIPTMTCLREAHDLGHIKDGYTATQLCNLFRSSRITLAKESGIPNPVERLVYLAKQRGGLYLIGFVLLLLEGLLPSRPTSTFVVATKIVDISESCDG